MIIILSTYIAVVCLVPILLKLAGGKLNLFEPVVPAAVALISLFSIRPLAMLATGETDYYRGWYIGDALEITLIICAIGATTFVAGYMMPLRIGSPQIKYRTSVYNKSRLHVVCGIYVMIGLLLALVYLGSNPIDTLVFLAGGRSTSMSDVVTVHSEYLFSAPILISCAAILFIIFVGDRKLTISTSIVVLALILVPIAWFYLMGVRRFIIPCLFIPIVVFFLVRRIRPKLSLIMVVLPLFMILAALPFMRTEGARSQIGGFSDQVMFAFSRQDVIRAIFLGPDTEMLPTFAVEVQTLDSPGKFYYGAATLGDLLIAPIPSALIEKPMSARDRMLVDAFGEPCSAGPGGLCPDFSVIGTFYQDFWLPGVILGMTLLGWISRRVWRSYMRDPKNPLLIFNAATVSVFILIIIRAGFMPAFQWFLYFWIPVTIGIYLIVRREVRYS